MNSNYYEKNYDERTGNCLSNSLTTKRQSRPLRSRAVSGIRIRAKSEIA